MCEISIVQFILTFTLCIFNEPEILWLSVHFMIILMTVYLFNQNINDRFRFVLHSTIYVAMSHLRYKLYIHVQLKNFR